jgi:hypothetical protein
VARFVDPLCKRLHKKRALRAESVPDLIRAYRSIAVPYRFSLDIASPDRGHLVITDIFLGSTEDRDPAWEDWEKNIGILQLRLTTVGGFRIRTTPLATISGHAIARWYERSRSRDEARLIEDLRALADDADVSLDADRPSHLVMSMSGAWLGPVIAAVGASLPASKKRDELVSKRPIRVRSIRTFVESDALRPAQRTSVTRVPVPA